MRRSMTHLIIGIAFVASSTAQASKQGQSNPGSPRVVSLSLAPSQVNIAQRGHSLLPFDDGSRQLPFDDGSRPGRGGDAAQKAPSGAPKMEKPAGADGASFYNKAAQSLPAEPGVKQLGDWMKMPLRDLPQAQVRTALQQAKANLDLVSQAVKCKSCNWPPFVPGAMPVNLSEYRHLASLLCLKARLEIAQGQYDKAIETIGTGLAMSKHVGEAPTIIQALTGIAMASVMLRPIQDFAQTQGGPNLYPALHALPRPLVHIEVPISSELKNLESSTQYNALTRSAMRNQLEEAHKRVRATANRLDGDVAALECIEALRHFAAGHSGQLPAQLSDITDIQVPNDPATGKPFAYRIEGAKAILEMSTPKDGTLRDSTRYEIAVAR